MVDLQARCRALLTEMRQIYAECEEMARQESLLKASARDMEAWEKKEGGEIAIGIDDGAESEGAEWGKEDQADEEELKRRKAGVRRVFYVLCGRWEKGQSAMSSGFPIC